EDSTVPTPSIALNSDTGTAGDHITNDHQVNVTLATDVASWEYSLNGGTTWNVGVGTSFNMALNATYAAGQIQVQQTDIAGNISLVGSNAVQWQEDSTVPTPSIALNSDTGTAGDHITNDHQVNVTLATDVASWEYSLNGGTTWNVGVGTSFNMALNATYAAGQIQVQQTDIAGNISLVGSNAVQWQEDSTVPTPSIALNSDTGTAGDHITNDHQVNVTLATDVASWEYSLNGGTTWNVGVGTSFNMALNATYAAGQIQVQQTDIAGNISLVGSNAVQWQEDSTVPTPSIALNSDTGTAGDHITNDHQVNVTLATDVASWEYSLNGGTTWNVGVGTSFNMALNATYAAGQIQVQQTDIAGNISLVGSNAVQWQEDSTVPTPSIALNSDTGTAGDHITNDHQVNVTLATDVASWEYSLNGGTTSNGGVGTSFNMVADATYAAGQIQVQQTDIAGNISLVGSNAVQWQEDSTVPTPSIALNSDT